ncbi:DUF397 domain-containing protein [Spongiactinospora sp. TRM90649]|uniref:DUF397 domain-containing protein n=1 Tax=Spongiactinospora sp. TRM90649 TaxID=3031114 RepID=UPI0023F9CEF3|nr:DUF397 domain-containing protein [Spongiactinospora sp. TRM90649]MDF5756109.1 DUF397 domain-containing protein [Spongiactinospora sp. TRM90649]
MDNATEGPDAELSTAAWRRSSRSNAGGNCVEIARLSGGRVALRDSKDARGPALVVDGEAFAGLLATIKADRLDP